MKYVHNFGAAKCHSLVTHISYFPRSYTKMSMERLFFFFFLVCKKLNCTIKEKNDIMGSWIWSTSREPPETLGMQLCWFVYRILSRDPQAPDSKQKMATRKSFIVGLTWKKLGSGSPGNDENEPDCSPVTRSKSRENNASPLGDQNAKKSNKTAMKKLVRMDSVRDVFGSFRQVGQPKFS